MKGTLRGSLREWEWRGGEGEERRGREGGRGVRSRPGAVYRNVRRAGGCASAEGRRRREMGGRGPHPLEKIEHTKLYTKMRDRPSDVRKVATAQSAAVLRITLQVKPSTNQQATLTAPSHSHCNEQQVVSSLLPPPPSFLPILTLFSINY